MTDQIKMNSEESQVKLENAECKNCKTQFTGKYCPNCGQSVYEFEKPFRFLIVDLAGNIFAFDTRIWKSMTSLIFRPGKFAQEYLSGYRARYMSPFRLYIFMSFIFFLLLSIYAGRKIQISEKDRQEINLSINEQLNPTNTSADSLSTNQLNFDTTSIAPEKLSNALTRVLNDPKMYMDSFLKFVSWSLFFLMPVYAFFLWMIFRKSKKYYYSHLVLAINQHTFVFLLFIVIICLKLIFPIRTYYPENYLIASIPIYLFFGKLHLYKRSWGKTLLRMLAILLLYGITMCITLFFIWSIWIKMELL
ncbi:DUF3667 domain-containing protein [Arenibacter sp. N53]|uniref:DUF3667 domain-containing protein n=2 Tax=Arenibacter TaxID=178469 RepID=UPI000CD47AB8|nr:DUF3667 domain-containing protein [Arenibacter hampyeongensis]MCM4150871.1 DUF3667 domain-containing protein [Arenibacter sp. N53]